MQGSITVKILFSSLLGDRHRILRQNANHDPPDAELLRHAATSAASRRSALESETAKAGEVPPDNQFLNLSSAVGNRQNSRLSEKALDWIFFRNPVSAMN